MMIIKIIQLKIKEKFHQLAKIQLLIMQSIKSDIKDLIKEEFNDDTR